MVEISVRDNELFSFTRQKKIDHATNITGEIAAYAYQIFKENYNWSKPIRSVGVRGADLVTDNYWEQIDLFSSVEKREKQMKMDSAVDDAELDRMWNEGTLNEERIESFRHLHDRTLYNKPKL